MITSNDHWKSQVRHALYTGGRFERVPSNGEYWQLTSASRGSAAELVKVLVRADDNYLHIRATLELTPSGARATHPKTHANQDTRQHVAGGSSRHRRKRNGTSPAIAATDSLEAMCDSVDPLSAPRPNGGYHSLRQHRGRHAADSNAPDNHSTQEDEDFEDDDVVRDLPHRAVHPNNNRSKRVSRKPTWKVANASEDDEEAPFDDGRRGWAPLYYNDQALKDEMMEEDKFAIGSGGGGLHPANTHVHQASRNSADPSTLRWGSTCLRSTYIISATAGESSGLSAGRTPLLPGRRVVVGGTNGGTNGGQGGGVAAPGRGRDASAEADSVPMKKYRQTYDSLPQSKRQAVPGGLPPTNSRQLPTPQAQHEGPGSAAQMTPPFISQWAEAMQHHLEEAAANAQKQRQNAAAAAGGSLAAEAAGEAAAAAAAAGWPSAGIPGLPAGFPPMAMLPAMLPGLIAAAAPFFPNPQAQQQMQQQMQAIMSNPSAAAAAVAAASAHGLSPEEK